VFCFDVAPRPETLRRFEESERITWGSYPFVSIANIYQEQYASPSRILSVTVLNAINEALLRNHKILCVYNKKGVGSDLRCRDCYHGFYCPQCNMPLVAFSHTLECTKCRYKEPLALHCPSCHCTSLRSMNPGNVEVAQELKQLFPKATVQVIDKEHSNPPDANIIVTTTYYYEAFFDPFRTNRGFGAVIHLSVDSPLYDAKPTAIEDLQRDIWQWAWFAFAYQSQIVLQTASTDLVRSCIENPFVAAYEELVARNTYQLPPMFKWFRVLLKESDTRTSEIAMQRLLEQIKAIPGVVVHPIRWSHEKFPVIDCGILTNSESNLLLLFSSLPDSYIIDTNVFS